MRQARQQEGGSVHMCASEAAGDGRGGNGSRHHGLARRRLSGTVSRAESSRGSLLTPQSSVRRETRCEEEYATRSPLTTSQLAHTSYFPPRCTSPDTTHTLHVRTAVLTTRMPPRGHHCPRAPSTQRSSPLWTRQPSQKDRRRHPKFKFSEFHCNIITFTHFMALSMIYHIDFHYYYYYQEGTLPSMGKDQRITQHTLPRPQHTRY